MRAVRRIGGRLELAHTPFPSPGPGQVLVRATSFAIASPDLAVASGRLEFQGVVGHECAGVVEAAGAAIEGKTKSDPAKWIGKRVVVTPNIPCGRCEMCKHGMSPHCPQRAVMGLHAHDGCFADAFVAPVGNLVEVPRKVTDDAAACASTVAGALHACAMVRVEHKPFVTVLGDGPMGLLVAQVLARRNASVRLLGMSPAKFQLCERWGIKHRHIAECGQRQDQDVVVDCTGSARGTQAALSMLRPRGTAIVKGWPMPPGVISTGEARVALGAALAGEITIVGAGAGSLGEAILAMERAEVDVGPLLTRRFRLADWGQAYEAARDAAVVKVAMVP